MGVTVIRCASSRCMTGLLTWRNPLGSEEGWALPLRGVESRWKNIGKVITAEIGVCFLTLTSAIETVAYSALALVSLALYPVNDSPYKFFAKLLQSSSFTIIWGLADAIVYNPFLVNIITRESLARYWAAAFNPTSMVLLRLEDIVDLADWAQRVRQREVNNQLIGPILAQGRATQQLISQGAHFIQQDVLANASAETISLFREADPSIYMFILSKAIYIYTGGAKKEEEIPNFFKQETKNLILSLRQELNNGETAQELQRLMADPNAFETEPQGELAKSVFGKLRNIASGELQNSLFTTRCWQRAVEQLPAE